jgi:Tannase and feruloyl esterase
MRVFPLLVAVCGFAMSGMPGEAQDANAAANAGNDKCAALAALAVPNASIVSAKTYAVGTFSGPPDFTGRDLSGFYKTLPAFCQVVIKAKPTSDSDITIGVWMPLEGWNGRLQGLGNGGFAGVMDQFELGAAIAKGYAATATDTGHTGSPIDAGWALGHPEKVVDFGHRGIHEMTTAAKLVVQKFYGSGPSRSYFAGCSDGGREALMEAQRYPADYDGILAGAPANNWTGLLSMAADDTQALTATPASFIPQAKIPAIAQAVSAQCDKHDGVADGILNDPRQCKFDPASIQCKEGEDTDKCLTAPQVTALKAIYAGMKDSRGKTIFPGYLPGAEEGAGGWGLWITGPAPGHSLMAMFAGGYFPNMVYEKKDWDLKSFTVDSGVQAAKEKTANALDAVDPNLTAFRSRGGKLILYHGWNDPAIPALSTVNYYQDVLGKLGQGDTDSFARLYMVPGMQHCAGGPGADVFGQSGTWASDPQRNARTALETWVEKGTAPGVIVATRTAGQEPGASGEPVMTRPLCPYPQSAQYKGSGDANRAESFACAAGKK